LILFAKVSWSIVLAVKGYTKNGDRNYDFAMIVLDNDVGNNIGYLGFGYKPSIQGLPIDVSGYPAGKAFANQWHSECDILSARLSQSRFIYQCSTYTGESGGPVMYYDQNSDSYIAYGVNVAQYTDQSMPYNIAKRIDQVAYDRINNWLQRY